MENLFIDILELLIEGIEKNKKPKEKIEGIWC